ncbi:MAG TPA: SHOCT domain-containing protein [Patescibacteria group bacterium]
MFFNKDKKEVNLLYETSYMGSNIKVFPNKLVFKMMGIEQSIPIGQIASVELGMPMLWQIVVETTGGKKYKIPTRKKKEVQQAIYDAQASVGASQGSSSSLADELEKLNDLVEKGVLTKEEFDKKKKELLNS